MAGFEVDPVALEGAIRKLEETRDLAHELSVSAVGVESGELSAKDSDTRRARQIFSERASGSEDSMQRSAESIRDKLDEKIHEYRATLEEYQHAEENATVDADQLHRQT